MGPIDFSGLFKAGIVFGIIAGALGVGVVCGAVWLISHLHWQ